MPDRSEALKKIKYQTSKKKGKAKAFAPEKIVEVVQGLLDANVEKENIVVKSEMPEEIMGIKIDWTLDPKALKSEFSVETRRKEPEEKTIEIEVEPDITEEDITEEDIDEEDIDEEE